MAEDALDIHHFGDQLVGLRIEQAVHTGEQDHPAGMGQLGHPHGKHVVIAEFQFLHRHRVVLVDDRQDPRLGQQAAKRAGNIGRALRGAEVRCREQHLCGGDLEIFKQAAVGVHQPRLADCRTCLPGGHILGILLQPEGRNARTHRAGRNKQAAMPGIDQGSDRSDQMHQRGTVERAIGGFRQHACAGLDHGDIGLHGR